MSNYDKKSATISGWQALGDFAAVKDQLRKLRASTRSTKEPGTKARPLPPLPGAAGGNKSVRFSLPGGGHGPFLSGSEASGSDQGYESDQSRVRKNDHQAKVQFESESKFGNDHFVIPTLILPIFRRGGAS